MQPNKTLEIVGKISTYPLAELLAESFHSKFSGSFRLSNQQFKVIIYLKEGEIVLIASNSARDRLSEILMEARILTAEQLKQVSPFENEFDLSQKLVKSLLLKQADLDVILSNQLITIIRKLLEWNDGDWIFSPLSRAKTDINYFADIKKLLVEHARKASSQFVSERFSDPKSSFSAEASLSTNLQLNPQEAFIFSRIEGSQTIEEISQSSGLPDYMVSQSLYTLWLAGLVVRQQYDSAFSDEVKTRFSASGYKISERIKPLLVVETKKEVAETTENIGENNIDNQINAGEMTMDIYLAQVEAAVENHYHTLGVTEKAENSEIKTVYFGLAKLFHPDKFHNEEEVLKKRIQNAFTCIAQAYDTLKRSDSRDLYDFRLRRRKENQEIEREEDLAAEKAGETIPVDNREKIKLAKKYFDQGFDHLMAHNEETAVPFLANAVNLNPDIARYHAYYGKSLISNKKFRHQAENELQTAIKLEPDNANFRIMLIEFYLEVGLAKRADGELQRLLRTNPDNKEAIALLDKITNK
jgi:curved DNA-binding protein CbpA/DNA-binding HxlR family transcriptional regulator